MQLGVLIQLDKTPVDAKLKTVHDLGFTYCQIACWDENLMTDEIAEQVISACEKYGITISTFWCGWWGPRAWNFYDGPLTLGLVPAEFRRKRIENLMHGSDFAKKLGVDKMATHVGFLPETPNTKEFHEVVCAIRVVAQYCKDNGQCFLFETGQETPVTLLRTIEEVGTGNLGINLDPANLILYGKANPVDALDVFGKYVMDVHAKDGLYPTNGRELGTEVKIGDGKVNFPAFIAKLKEVGYDGTLIIEREIEGEQQTKDIAESKMYLSTLI
jgi:sugar phosphate isomerase/epimerase